MPLINGHIGFARDSMGINRIQEYPFDKLIILGFVVVLEGERRRLNELNISQRRRIR